MELFPTKSFINPSINKLPRYAKGLWNFSQSAKHKQDLNQATFFIACCQQKEIKNRCQQQATIGFEFVFTIKVMFKPQFLIPLNVTVKIVHPLGNRRPGRHSAD